ncbi:MAG: M28 family metallopeptidase [Dehalococcoidia bacterium]
MTTQEFPFDAGAYLSGRVDAAGETYPARALRGSAGGTATAQLRDAGIGRPEDYPPAGLTGDIVLIERGDLTIEEKAANARAAGASAAVIYNNEDGIFSITIDPSPIPVVAISRQSGLALAGRLEAGQLEATVTVAPPRGTAANIIAKPPGVTACETVSGGHADSVAVTGGADDNASGTAAVLELARVVAASHLTGANCFVLFGAEEAGLLGSRAFVAGLSTSDFNALRAMLNLDVVGLPKPLELLGSPDLVEVARLAAQRIDIEASPSELPANVGSDHLSFLNRGIPVVMFYRHDELIHTPADAIDRISAESLEETVRAALATLQALFE